MVMDEWRGDDPGGEWLPDLTDISLDDLCNTTDPELAAQLDTAIQRLHRQLTHLPEPEITYWNRSGPSPDHRC